MIKSFMLFAVITSNQGIESIVSVNHIEYTSKYHCLLDKVQYTDSNNVKFFCSEKDLFNKINLIN